MKIVLVPSSSSSGRQRKQYVTSVLVNRSIALDAGCLGFYGSLARQQKVKHIFLTHSHLDHVASLPMFLDNVYDGSGDCPTIYGLPHTLDCLRTDVFNNRLFPDFIKISTIRPPYLKLQEVTPGETLEVDGLRITPVEVNHAVPALGYVLQEGETTVVHSGDTAATEEIWKVATRSGKLAGVFLEVAFPNRLNWLADIAKHHTPESLTQEMAKLPPGTRVFAIHLHPRLVKEVATELKALARPELRIARFGRPYRF